MPSQPPWHLCAAAWTLGVTCALVQAAAQTHADPQAHAEARAQTDTDAPAQESADARAQPQPPGRPALPPSRPTFNVAPTQLVIPRAGASTSLVLRNESPAPLRFQITAFAWTNARDGAMQLAPTNDVLFFPSLFTVAAGQTRRVRVGSTQRATDREISYRLIIEQLASRAEARPAGGVEMLTRLNVPVFLEPPKRVAKATLDGIAVRGDTLSFDIHNGGSVHLRIREVIVRGLSRADALAHTETIAGWYLLPDETRHYDVALAPDVCRALATAHVTATFAHPPALTLEERAAIPADACNGR